MGENDVRSNLEQTINKTLQSKWNTTMGNSSKKSLFPSSIYNSNYDLTDNPSNDFESVENRNAIASNLTTFNDVNGAASLDMLQSITMQSNEKSISIKNHCGNPLSSMQPAAAAAAASAATTSNLRLAGNKRHANRTNGITTQFHGSDYGQRRRRLNNSDFMFESIRPMKTQCDTLRKYFVLQLKCEPI